MADNVSFTSIHDFYHYYINFRIYIYNLENGKITGMIIPSIVSFWRGKEKSSMAELGLTNSGNWSCVFDQSWRGEENRANSNRIQTWPISHFTGESWLVTSRARFEASYFGIEPGNVVKPLSRPTIPQLPVLFTFSDLIQPLSIVQQFLYIFSISWIHQTLILNFWRMKLINISGHVLYIYSLP